MGANLIEMARANVGDPLAQAARRWRAPWTVSELALSDASNWTSFPPHYPHLVRFPHDDGSSHIAIRMRNAKGTFEFVGYSNADLDHMIANLERFWSLIGDTHNVLTSYLKPKDFDVDEFERDFDEFFLGTLEAERNALADHPQDPAWASPLVPVDMNRVDRRLKHAMPPYALALDTTLHPAGRWYTRYENVMYGRPIEHDFGSQDLGKEMANLKRAFARRGFIVHLYEYDERLSYSLWEVYKSRRAFSAFELTRDGWSAEDAVAAVAPETYAPAQPPGP